MYRVVTRKGFVEYFHSYDQARNYARRIIRNTKTWKNSFMRRDGANPILSMFRKIVRVEAV